MIISLKRAYIIIGIYFWGIENSNLRKKARNIEIIKKNQSNKIRTQVFLIILTNSTPTYFIFLNLHFFVYYIIKNVI